MGPRVLRIDLGALAGSGVARDLPPFTRAEAFLAGLGGSALGLALLSEHARRSQDEALVVAVGEAVRDGLPTAARAAVLARAPLSGLYAEGHVGGTLGARLARLADALFLTGVAPGAGAVLVVEEGGTASDVADGAAGGVRLLARPALAGAAPAETARTLEEELGPCAVLAIGPAGERGLPFASLAVGHAPPSFVGRGGLGLVLARLGLKALVVRAELPRSAPAPRAGAGALVARLGASPRLAARAAGGTLELFEAAAGRGEPGAAAALSAEARARAGERHGCRGCPTPCGWVFERSDGARQGARFGASQALGPGLGLATLDDALALLARCDALGLDAKEAGAVLALECTARERGLLPGPSARGDRAALAARLDALVADPAAPGRHGAARLALELGLAAEVPTSRGQALRPEKNLAALLGQCVASGGTDPMRSFPFLLEAGSRARLAALLAPLPVPPEVLDPHDPRAKGRLVFWHENLVAAVDVAGFCAFSAAGLLLDDLCDLDELAAWILPASLRDPEEPAWRALAPAQRLLAAGANVVLARHALNERYAAGAPSQVDLGSPAFARESLAAPGMLDEYRALRGLDADGRLSPASHPALGTPRALTLGPTLSAAPCDAPPPTGGPSPATRGRITVRTSGALADALGPTLALDVRFPATVAAVLADAATSAPARALLFHHATLVPAVWRAGRRLAAEDEVQP
ncbi:MAG TPA: aldehyde ferredoxin oxidoreductase N-terminal domain-containing protein, partial [Planctomycetota bacterium]